MRKYIIPSLLLVILAVSCAKSKTTLTNQADKLYFDSWVKTYYPDLADKEQFPGYYILSDVEGTGETIGTSDDTPYYQAKFTVKSLEGTILQTSEEMTARQVGTYDPTYFYGPNTFSRVNSTLYAGVEYAIRDMKVGGKREILIPAYLITTSRYDTQDEYVDAETSGVDCNYYLEITERISDIVTWETDSLKRYMKKVYHYTDEQCEKDTLKAGYYKVVKEPSATGEKFANDTTIYINYIGRRLDGQVFDTTIEDTAKFYNLYNSSNTYGPISAEIDVDTYTSTTISSGTSVIDGFSYLLNSMGPFETSVGIFYSAYGYSYSGSGYAIPAYCPLIFEISVVEEPED